MPIITDNRPSIAEYAMLSEHVYHPWSIANPNPDAHDEALQLPDGTLISNWQLHKEWRYTSVLKRQSGFVARLFINPLSRHFVLAYRGTKILSIGDLYTDYKAILNDVDVAQHQEMLHCIDYAIKQAQEHKYGLSFTGHSLGGYLAELSLIILAQRTLNLTYPIHFSATAFDSPGGRTTFFRWLTTKNSLVKIPPYTKRQATNFLAKLDTSNILFHPNRVNIINQHTGMKYYLPCLLKKWEYFPTIKTLQKHSMSALIFHITTNNSYHIIPMYKWPTQSAHINLFHLSIQKKYLRIENKVYKKYTLPQFYPPKSPDFAFVKQLITSANFQPKIYKDAEKLITSNHLIMEKVHFAPIIQNVLESLHDIKITRPEEFRGKLLQLEVLYMEKFQPTHQYNRYKILLFNLLSRYTLYNQHASYNYYVRYSEQTNIWSGIIAIPQLEHITVSYNIMLLFRQVLARFLSELTTEDKTRLNIFGLN